MTTDGLRETLVEQVLRPVAERMRERADSLSEMPRFEKAGLEGWFRVEIVAILKEKVAAIRNKGPDLILDDGTELELKGATDFNVPYIRSGVTRDNCLCLFLADGSDSSRIDKVANERIRLIGHETVSLDGHTWVIGLIGPQS